MELKGSPPKLLNTTFDNSSHEARQDVFWYIEVFYNRSRRHAALGYVSPVTFEEQQGWKKDA